MKKKSFKIMIISLAIVLVSLAGYIGVMAVTGGPGSADDPMVTKSYVDKIVAEKIAAAKTEMETAISADNSLFVHKSEVGGLIDSKINSAAGTGIYGYNTVSFSAEQTVACRTGTELVVRSGNVIAGAGLLNVSSGNSVAEGQTVPAGSYIIFTADGSFKATAGCEVLIRGTYN